MIWLMAGKLLDFLASVLVVLHWVGTNLYVDRTSPGE